MTDLCPECTSLRATVADLLTELVRMVRCVEHGAQLGDALGNPALKHCAGMAKLAIAATGGEPERHKPKTPAPTFDEAPPYSASRGDPTSARSWVLSEPKAPLIVEGFHTGGEWIAAREPIKLRVSPNPRYGMLDIVNCEPFYLGASGSTEDELRENVGQEFDLLWRRYALEDDAKLTEAAQKLKRELLAAFRKAGE